MVSLQAHERRLVRGVSGLPDVLVRGNNSEGQCCFSCSLFSYLRCPACEDASPQIYEVNRGLTLHYFNSVLGQADVVKEPELAQKQGITTMPSIVFYKDGITPGEAYHGKITARRLYAWVRRS